MNSAFQSVINSHWLSHPSTRDLVKEISALREECLSSAIVSATVQDERFIRAQLVKAGVYEDVLKLIQNKLNPTN